MPRQHQEDLLDRHLATYLGPLGPATMRQLREHLEWVDLGAGATLMSEGDPGDAMYLVVSGRLRAYAADGQGGERMLREMGRGQVIGEMSLYTGEPRSASVVAIRDSVLVRLAREPFERVLAGSAELSMAMTRQVIERFRAGPAQQVARPGVVTLLPVSAGVDAAGFARRLAVPLARAGRVCVVGAADAADAERLDALEAAHDFVLLVAHEQPDAWTALCCRSCDDIVLLADAAQPPALHDNERLLAARAGRAEAAERLVLLHAADSRLPRGTRAWLDRRPVAEHLHVRPALDRDMARLARWLSHTAVGLVLAGGGARGLAHLGIYRALVERGIEVDCVGGTSIGAVMGALVAADRPPDEVVALARRAFATNPTGDFNALPLLSLIAGRRLRKLIDGSTRELLGGDADIEDLWKRYFCVVSNYSKAAEVRFARGPLAKAVRASVSIPGALPPVVHDGDLLCDGGTFNNFPVDAMRAMRGIGQVIGVDLDARRLRRIEHDETPGPWALLLDRLRPRGRRRYRLPSLMAYLMNVTILVSTSRRDEARRLTDLYFNPPLERVGMLQWNRFDGIVAQGHEYALQQLDALDAERLARLKPAAA